MSVLKLEEALKGLELVELGQYLEEKMPVHPNHSKFFRTRWHSFSDGDMCNDYQLILNEHNGTHVDSFAHYVEKPGYEWIDEIPLRSLCGPCVTIDATFLGKLETLEREHIEAWERENAPIRPGDIVLLDFGWMRHWALRPNGGRFIADYPGLGATGAACLAERKIKMVGVDTLSVDACGADGDPAHNCLLPNRIPIVENLRNLNQLYGKRAYFVMLPLLIRGGSASPVRPVALL